MPDTAERPSERPRTAFVLGGGGVLGASEVGMLSALADAGVQPDLVLGTSIGAVNGSLLAAGGDDIDRLSRLWTTLTRQAVWGGSAVERLRLMARTRTALHDSAGLRVLLERELDGRGFADLEVPFECCAASVERAAEHWFTDGSLVDAVLASCAVPGLFPPVRIAGEHFMDGGLVNSIPVGRAIERGARTVWVLQVGRVEQPLEPPTQPWQVATVAFEIARRHRFARDLAAVPEGVTVHILPSGDAGGPTANLRYRDTRQVAARIERARSASAAYLAALPDTERR